MKLFRTLTLLLFLIWAAAPAFASIIIDNFTTATNDRFANDDSFILDGFDLSGVGRSSDGKWGTLVSNNVFLSSNHSRPGIGANLTFYETNDASGNSITRTVASGQRIGSTDMWIGVLSAPVTSSYSSFALVTTDIADADAFGTSVLNGALAFMVGRSPTDWTNSLQDVAVGTNRIDVWAEDSSAAGTTDDAISAIYQLPTNNTSYEALLQGGDSGGPMFVTDGSSLFLAGINWWVGDVDVTIGETTTQYQLSGFSYVGNHDVSISNFVTLNAVPEPAAVGFIFGCVCLGFTLQRRRRRQHV